jgi:cytochrome-b5 reductase
LGAAAAGAAYFGYGYVSGGPAAADPLSSKAEQKNVPTKAGDRTADKPAPKAFTGGEQGFLDLKLSNVEIVNHNTKRFRFDLPEKDQVSGLDIACEHSHLALYYYKLYTHAKQ